MFISQLRIENFRMFGEGIDAFVLTLDPGLTALVGENDNGKTSVIDALRLVLGTRDQESFRMDESDFHQPRGSGIRRKEIRICCKFEDLTTAEVGTFAEYLTYEEADSRLIPVLYLNWKATQLVRANKHRRFISIELRSSKAGDGPAIDLEARGLLCAAYLRPLRDAERAMSAGRGSRLSQILQYTSEVIEAGTHYDPAAASFNPADLSVVGIGDFANALLGDHVGVQSARQRLNSEYLEQLCFSGKGLEGHISVSGAKGEDTVRLRLLLEKLDLELREGGSTDAQPNRGLGSNNLLFMACELLLLAEDEGFPILLIEEPEAHLHPQRQLRLMQFLQKKAAEPREDGKRIQIIVTTHSPNLASVIDLRNMILLHGGQAFPLGEPHTELDKADYGFLRRFLDVTKANLFFARGLLIVEGDAENIVIPTIARLLGRDLTEHGISIINVGGVGLRRYARIYQRKRPDDQRTIDVPIACITDIDVMPDCAPLIIGNIKAGDSWPAKTSRRWYAARDFTAQELAARRADIDAKASGQRVQTFYFRSMDLRIQLGVSRACGASLDFYPPRKSGRTHTCWQNDSI
jgi:putative ATP-dependent endonuclease of the OLD family